MAQLTYPTLVEKFGGQAGYIKKLESTAAEVKQGGVWFKKYTFGEPSQLIEAYGAVYAVVPMQLEVTGPKKNVGRLSSYLIAVSQDRGVNWKFIDGFGIAGDRSKVKLILPNFPDKLELPAIGRLVWDK